MPLKQSSSRAAFEHNLKAEFAAGKPRDQSLAIAYRVARENRAMGGRNLAMGARPKTHAGAISSIVPGRTDHIPMKVKPGSYVVPAETVSHLGQSNTQAGLAILSDMFGPKGPYGGALRGIPKPIGFADGGGVDDPVDINAAGGEFVIDPSVVAAVGDGDIEHGHEVLDAWIMNMRKQHIKTLKGLAPPAKD